MKKLDSAIFKVFVVGLPIVFAMALIANLIGTQKIESSFGVYNALSGLVFGLWMIFALYLSVKLVISQAFRVDILPRMILFRERDEREAQISAHATRSSFLTTLAVLIFFLCLSGLQVAIYRVSPEHSVNGKTGTITMGVDMNLVTAAQSAGQGESERDYFRYSGLPISKFAILLFLIFFQFGSYNYFARRLRNENAWS